MGPLSPIPVYAYFLLFSFEKLRFILTFLMKIRESQDILNFKNLSGMAPRTRWPELPDT